MTPWARLEHAYGDAADLPDRLTPLLSEDSEAVARALAVLDAAVLHQGTIYSSTAPVAVFVAGILADPRTAVSCEGALPWDPRVRPVRAALLEWLAVVADSAAFEEYDDRDTLACRAVRADLVDAVLPFLDDPADPVRVAALAAAGHLLRAPELATRRTELADRLRSWAANTPPVDRVRVALTLSCWGIAPHEALTDPDPVVRAYAAISPALDTDPRALDEVRTALRDPESADAWFADEPLPHLDHRFGACLVEALLRRTATFEEVEEEAAAVARSTEKIGLTPMLERAFTPPVFTDDQLTPAQRRFRDVLDKHVLS